MKNNGITEYFEEVETEEEYKGYFCRIPEVITIVILGCMCGLKNVKQIHQWASNGIVSEFLKEKFGISHVPCYYWILCMLKMIKTESLNHCFMDWVYSFMPENEQMTISVDGKEIRSTNRLEKCESPLHIISAQITELGLTLAQRCTDDKSNEIPAVQKLLKELNIQGHMIVADAMNCQKETAEIIIGKEADYLLCVKGNHPVLEKEIEDYIQDKTLRNTMSVFFQCEKNHGRAEKRTAYTTTNIGWLSQKNEWKNLCCIGAIHTEISTKKESWSEWRYYISNRKLTAQQLLHHARMEWNVESMHWLLDVHFEEDFCLIESKAVQQHLNMFRKAAINLIKLFKSRTETKRPISNIMLDCLINPSDILRIIGQN